MKIQVNKFMLAHEGCVYKAGDVVDIADDTVAKKLVADSSGELSFAQDAPAAPAAIASEGKPAAEVDSAVLPVADPAAAVSSGKKK